VIRHESKPVRRSPGWRPNSTHIVPSREANGCWIRAIFWANRDGTKYALGYTRHPRLFGERQRKTRKALLLSVAQTIEMQFYNDGKNGATTQ
jgi:hypothetical protein